jgi:hypothetical protein
MKPNRKLIFTLSILILFFIFLPSMLHAQIDPEGDPDLPLDGGVGVLIAIGVGYGLKKMRDHKKNDRNKIQS